MDKFSKIEDYMDEADDICLRVDSLQSEVSELRSKVERSMKSSAYIDSNQTWQKLFQILEDTEISLIDASKRLWDIDNECRNDCEF